MATTRQIREVAVTVLGLAKQAGLVPQKHALVLRHGNYDLGVPWRLYTADEAGTWRPFPGCLDEKGCIGHSRAEAHAHLRLIITKMEVVPDEAA